mmetsp:Transcript_12150/g.36655  ORF Transcript_12150/g.36655 Transcript_12150/m.36655 type:complete len:135 (+) Transcript_12150:513-917(+)
MIENALDLVDHVLVMTANPGFGGQAYICTLLPKIRKIRKWIVDRGLDIDIEMDGGIKANKTILECAEAGANCFIAGSGLFAYDDLSQGVGELRELAEEGEKAQRIRSRRRSTPILWCSVFGGGRLSSSAGQRDL